MQVELYHAGGAGEKPPQGRRAAEIYPVRFHRARAAFWAMALRCSGLNFLARASPPFLPPSLPKATACGFFLWEDLW